MPDLRSLLELQGTMFLLIGLGAVLQRRGLIPPPVKLGLTDLVIDVILPCNIIHSFRMEFRWSILRDFLVVLAISGLIQLLSLLVARFAYNREEPARRAVLKYGTVCSNAGFMGMPLAEGLYGAQGLLCASVYLIPQRIVMWSIGVAYFTGAKGKGAWRRILLHPCIVAVEIGLVLMVFQVPLPQAVEQTIQTVGGCNTALSMLLIGSILAEVDLRTVVRRTSLFYAAVRLLLIPLAVFAGCRCAGVEPMLATLSVLLSGMPAGSTTAILATRYGGDSALASQCMVLTTLLSLLTIPLWSLLMLALF